MNILIIKRTTLNSSIQKACWYYLIPPLYSGTLRYWKYSIFAQVV